MQNVDTQLADVESSPESKHGEQTKEALTVTLIVVGAAATAAVTSFCEQVTWLTCAGMAVAGTHFLVVQVSDALAWAFQALGSAASRLREFDVPQVTFEGMQVPVFTSTSYPTPRVMSIQARSTARSAAGAAGCIGDANRAAASRLQSLSDDLNQVPESYETPQGAGDLEVFAKLFATPPGELLPQIIQAIAWLGNLGGVSADLRARCGLDQLRQASLGIVCDFFRKIGDLAPQGNLYRTLGSQLASAGLSCS